jgi:hypothetical protein
MELRPQGRVPSLAKRMRIRRPVIGISFFVIACRSTPQDDDGGSATEQTTAADTRAARRAA